MEEPVEETPVVASVTTYTEAELTAMTNAKLKAICDELGVSYTASATKATLVQLVLLNQG